MIYSIAAMKLFLIVAIFSLGKIANAQFDRSQIQAGFGISEPYNDLEGEYLAYMELGNYQALTVNPDFMTNNYGAKTGLNFFAKYKFNFDKYSIVRGVVGVNYSSFNTFQSTRSGNIGVQVININNELDTFLTSVNYDYGFSNFGIGLGLELAPTSFTNVLSPYFGASFMFNFMGGELSRTENNFDSVKSSFNDFRMGINFDAGMEVRISSSMGIALGLKYDLGNLLLKNTNSGISDALEYGKTNGSLNDEEGRFFSSVYGPVLTSVRKEVISKKKEINWGTAYIALNINLDSPKKKTKSAPPKK